MRFFALILTVLAAIFLEKAYAQEDEGGDVKSQELTSPTLPQAEEEAVIYKYDEDQGFIGNPLREGLAPLRINSLGLRFGGRFAFDLINYGHANKRDSGLDISDARIYVEGQWDKIGMRFEPDLLGKDTHNNLFEAWVSYRFSKSLKLSVGQFPMAMGSEFATYEENLPMIGYGFTSYLDGRYDLGARANGDIFPSVLWYETIAGSGHGFDLEGNRLKSPKLTARMVYHPFGRYDPVENYFLGRLSGFFVGGAAAYLWNYEDKIVLANPLESTVLATQDLNGDGSFWVHLESGYSVGPFRIGGEKVWGRVKHLPIGAGRHKTVNELESWTAYSSWILSGERQVWRDGRWVYPKAYGAAPKAREKVLDGLWELSARYSNADMDRDLFRTGYAAYDPSTQEVRTFTLNLNWYPVHNARFALGWVNTIADHDLGTFGNSKRDSSFILRLELVF